MQICFSPAFQPQPLKQNTPVRFGNTQPSEDEMEQAGENLFVLAQELSSNLDGKTLDQLDGSDMDLEKHRQSFIDHLNKLPMHLAKMREIAQAWVDAFLSDACDTSEVASVQSVADAMAEKIRLAESA